MDWNRHGNCTAICASQHTSHERLHGLMMAHALSVTWVEFVSTSESSVKSSSALFHTAVCIYFLPPIYKVIILSLLFSLALLLTCAFALHLLALEGTMSGTRSRISEEELKELMSKLQSLLPETRRRRSERRVSLLKTMFAQHAIFSNSRRVVRYKLRLLHARA